jgi:pseudouridylate synthase
MMSVHLFELLIGIISCLGQSTRSLQVLETLGVCVAAYDSDQFPAFFSASSGCAAPARVDSAAQAAALVRSVQQLDLGSGIVIGQKLP